MSVSPHVAVAASPAGQSVDASLLNRLPPEVLGEIFVHYAIEVYKHNTTAERSQPRESVLPLSLVCRYWRNIALGTPQVWARIHNMSPSGTLEWLKRSKAAPLTYHDVQRAGEAQRDVALVEVAKNFYRMQDFEVHAQVEHVRRFCAEMADWSAPLLTRIHIFAMARVRMNTYPVFPSPSLEPGHYPSRLQHLHLENIFPRWDNPMLSSAMTSLSLHANNVRATDIGTQEELLDALRRMPRLKTITLEGVVPPPTSTKSSIPPIVLAQLRSLTVYAALRNSMQLLNYLSVPGDLVAIALGVGDEGEAEVLASALARAFRTAAPLDDMHLSLSDDRPGPVRWTKLRAWRPNQRPEAGRDPLLLSIHGTPADFPDAMRILASACRTRTLWVSAAERNALWPAILPSFPGVERLVVMGQHDVSFQRALAGAGLAGPFPNLRELRLERFVFMDGEQRTPAYEALLGFLEARRGDGRAIRRMSVRGPVDAEHWKTVYDTLKNVVQDVEMVD